MTPKVQSKRSSATKSDSDVEMTLDVHDLPNTDTADSPIVSKPLSRAHKSTPTPKPPKPTPKRLEASSSNEEDDDIYACQKCSKTDNAETMLLCDNCDKGKLSDFSFYYWRQSILSVLPLMFGNLECSDIQTLMFAPFRKFSQQIKLFDSFFNETS